MESLRTTCDTGEDWDPQAEILPDASKVLIWRREEHVVHRDLEPNEASALQAGLDGHSFADICGGVAARVGEEEAPGRAAGWLASWLGEGLLAGLTTD